MGALKLAAVEDRELVSHPIDIHYQPQLKISEDKQSLWGLEALLRAPEGYQFSTLDIVDAHFRSNMSGKLLVKLLHRLTTDLHQFAIKGLRMPSVSLNAEPSAFHDVNVPHALREVIDNCHRDGHGQVRLEITEREALTEYSSDVLHSLHEMGIQLVLDDFGREHSNLHALSSLPFSTVKMDRIMVTGIKDHEKNKLIMRHLYNLSQDAGFEVLAEGISCPDDLRELKELGVELFQGFMLGHPMSLPNIEKYLLNLSSRGHLVL